MPLDFLNIIAFGFQITDTDNEINKQNLLFFVFDFHIWMVKDGILLIFYRGYIMIFILVIQILVEFKSVFMFFNF